MLLESYTKEIQEAIAGYCRTGDLKKEINVDKNRLQHYRRLIRNVVNDTLTQAYPITFKITTSEEWNSMVDDFFQHKSENNPQIWKMPKDFLNYAEENHWDLKFNKPYLIDLLRLEWIEIEVHTMPDELVDDYETKGNLMDEVLVFNPEMRILRFDYPVHKAKFWNFEEMSKGDYFLLVYREQFSGLVKFIELSMVFTVLMEMIIREEKPVRELLENLAEIFKISDFEQLYSNTEKFIKDMHIKKVILGVKK